MNMAEILYSIIMGGHNVFSKSLTFEFIGQNVKVCLLIFTIYASTFISYHYRMS